MDLVIEAIPALSTNYIWALSSSDRQSAPSSRQSGHCVLIDPGESGGALDYLDDNGLQLDAVLLTHHHHDHVDGVEEILQHHRVPVWGPDDERIPVNFTAAGQDRPVTLDALDLELNVLEIPGHTRSHIAFYGQGRLFCGDTLFSVGCGRTFEGTPAQMLASLDKLADLPDDTLVYCAHEYTADNCRFALKVEPENEALRDYARRVQRWDAKGRITLPSKLGDEKRVNPFLRTREPDVIQAAEQREPGIDRSPESVFGVIRRWKDSF